MDFQQPFQAPALTKLLVIFQSFAKEDVKAQKIGRFGYTDIHY